MHSSCIPRISAKPKAGRDHKCKGLQTLDPYVQGLTGEIILGLLLT